MPSWLPSAGAQALPAATPPDCTQDPACESLRIRAGAASKAGDLVEALRLYQLAHGISADPRMLFNIARLQHRLGRDIEAMDSYERFLRAPALSDGDHPVRLRLAQQYMQQLRLKPRSGAAGVASALPSSAVSAVASQPGLATEPRAPIYKKWWFWTILGVTAAGIATGVGLGIAAKEPDTTGLMEYRP